MYDNVIKENIRRFRKAKGYTQANMAELLGISVTYYRSIESGDAVLLKRIIEDIAELFEVRVESILIVSEIIWKAMKRCCKRLLRHI